jgi:DNA-binding CsgD family transcriptional regulator/tetratricopeptide (TPR) repeat protein
MVGRADELDLLLDSFTLAARGHGAAALVGGEAGVGKSRLVGEVGTVARRRGARVLVGQCLDLEEGGLPYAPLVDMLRALERDLGPEEGAATLAPLLGHLGRDGGTAEGGTDQLGQARLFELLMTVVERLVASGPLVLVFEDLHWADRSTLDVVALLASATRALPVLTLGTYRSEDTPPRHPLRPVAAELTRRGARHLQLERLGAGEVAELLGALLREAPAPEVTASVVERSDGNPLFVEELADALAADPGAAMPPHLRDAVISRVERMPEDAAAVLRACAAGGREVEHDLLADVVTPPPDGEPGQAPIAGLDLVGLDRALRACVDHRLLVADQGRGTYRFRHALVHEAVLGDILPGELHRLHRAYALTLERRQASAAVAGSGGARGGRAGGEQSWARLAHHWAAAADFDRALGAAVRAGRAAEAAVAVPEAHRYLEWSVRLWDRANDPEAAAGCDRGELLARAADAASRAGSMVRALTLVDEALATPHVEGDPVRSGLLHERRGWYLHRTGRPDEALAAYELAVELVPTEPRSAARARVAHAYAHALVRVGRNDEARIRAEEAIELARAVDDLVDEGQALHVLGLVLATEGKTDEAVLTLHEAGQIAGRIGDLAEVAGAYVHLWRTLVEAGRGGDLVELVAFGTDPSGEGGPTLMGSIGAAALHLLGRWDEAQRLLGDPGRGDATGLTAAAHILVAGVIAVDRGDHEVARDQLETARAWCHQVGDGRLNGLLHRALTELAAWQGRFDDARREAAAGLELLAHTGDPELAGRIAAAGIRAEADRSDRADQVRRTGGRSDEGDAREVATGLLGRLRDLAATTATRNAPPATELAATLRTGEAELSRIGGAPDRDLWQQAVDGWEAIGFAYQAAYCRFRLAEAALAGGDDDRAAHELGAARETAERLGAAPLLQAIDRLARRGRVALAGASPGTPAGAGGAPAAAGGVDAGAGAGLTRREREVLALVAEGHTNRQIGEALFISEKTASVHVSRLLAKLGASTRGEAAAIARRSGLLGA